MTASEHALTPKEITRANERELKILWQDGHESVYASHPLRLRCPCAGCVDEMTGQVRILVSSIPADVYPLRVRLVGRYALHIDWSDRHTTGLYPFDLLRQLCPCAACAQRAAAPRP